MGEVIQFPDEADTLRGGRFIDRNTEPATVIILPVIRIDREPDGSEGSPRSRNGTSRRRRRRLMP